LRLLEPLIVGFCILVASADETGLDRLFRWCGRLLLVCSVIYLVLALVYACLGMDWLSLLGNGVLMALAGMFGVGFDRLVAYRRRLRADTPPLLSS
jgi:hypothetical protein